jgi:hypothetical protein
VDLAGLDPSTTYHYRFVASNEFGSDVSGGDRTFTTGDPVQPPCTVEPCRGYEMVTPPDKSGRVGGQDQRVDTPLVAIPSRDGESVLATTKWSLMDAEAGGSIPHSYNSLLIQRSSTGWKGQALNNVAPQEPSVAGLTNPAGVSPDLTVQGWQHNEWLFPSRSFLGTRVFGDSGGTIPGSGWYDWLGSGNDWLNDPEGLVDGPLQVDSALITDAGGAMVRWGGQPSTYRGLLGDADPSSPGYPSEHQQIAVDATGGTFTLTFSGQTTAAIAENATPTTVRTRLEALSNIATGEVVVTGADGGPWLVRFAGAKARLNPAPTERRSRGEVSPSRSPR